MDSTPASKKETAVNTSINSSRSSTVGAKIKSGSQEKQQQDEKDVAAAATEDAPVTNATTGNMQSSASNSTTAMEATAAAAETSSSKTAPQKSSTATTTTTTTFAPSTSSAPPASTFSTKRKSMTATPIPGATGTAAMDNHPFARGAVIEVLHGVLEEKESFWWSDSDSDEDDNNDHTSTTEQQDGHKTKSSSSTAAVVSVRLCDIIDRVAIGDGKWRYYIHYRDFNRRMDEWISMDRIVSPPSVGNAKVRAMKKEEERKQKKQKHGGASGGGRHSSSQANNKNDIAVAGTTSVGAVGSAVASTTTGDVGQPRSSRRRSSTVTPLPTTATSASAAMAVGSVSSGTPMTGLSIDTSLTVVTATAAATDAAAAALDSETPRRTRLRRRKSQLLDDDNNTVVASSAQEKSDDNLEPTLKETVVVLPSATATTMLHTTTVGEHVVATIPAQELDEHEGLDEASLREHEEVTKVKNVSFLELGPHRMETWYFSPLPKELLSEKGFAEVLYCCEFTLSLFARKCELQRFQARLPTLLRHPPGNEIYRNGNLSMFEIDGYQERIYAQNLSYIAKLFLDHKTLYFDVDPFLFYVLCEVDNRGFHIVGYFSKEKYSDVGYNLACILTFPSHQRKGYGRFLIAFSYELSKREEKVGSPEKPMSDLGQQAYKPYWASTILDFFLYQSDESNLSIMDISKRTSIMAEDIVFTLNQLGILKIINGVYFIAAERSLLERLAVKYPVKDPRVDPSKLHWTPFLTDIKRDKFSIHSKKPRLEEDDDGGAKQRATNSN